jgi:hypothetical protein
MEIYTRNAQAEHTHGFQWGCDQYINAGWWFGTFFSIIYGIILPIDEYFSEGLKPPTRKCKR